MYSNRSDLFKWVSLFVICFATHCNRKMQCIYLIVLWRPLWHPVTNVDYCREDCQSVLVWCCFYTSRQIQTLKNQTSWKSFGSSICIQNWIKIGSRFSTLALVLGYSQCGCQARLCGYDRVTGSGFLRGRNPNHEYHIFYWVLLDCFIFLFPFFHVCAVSSSIWKSLAHH